MKSLAFRSSLFLSASLLLALPAAQGQKSIGGAIGNDPVDPTVHVAEPTAQRVARHDALADLVGHHDGRRMSSREQLSEALRLGGSRVERFVDKLRARAAQRFEIDQRGGNAAQIPLRLGETYSLGPSLSYEIDLFGRIDSALKAARLGEEAVALMLFTVRGDIAQAHLTGASDRWRHLSPLKALIDGACDLARAHGATRLHLGAGRGGHEDSLYAFKSRFSPLRHDFVLGRWVLDPELHARLSAAAHPDGNADERYFPAYRAPPAPEGR
mgnify:CR=1 FL=1